MENAKNDFNVSCLSETKIKGRKHQMLIIPRSRKSRDGFNGVLRMKATSW